jgi:hypothetical protein
VHRAECVVVVRFTDQSTLTDTPCCESFVFFSRLKNQNRDSKIVLLLCVHADDAGRGGRPRAVAKLYSFSSNVSGSSRIDQLPDVTRIY